MPTLLEHESRMPRALAWTREDCQRMDEIGLLPPRWELIRGEVISKMGQRVPHGRVVRAFFLWLSRLYGEDFVLSQVSIDVSPADNPTSEPEPDVFVLTEPSAFLRTNLRPSQIPLLVEVADTTLSFDLRIKGPLLAEAGISEYWVMDVRGRRLHRFRDPVNGTYQRVDILGPDDTIQPPGHDESATIESFLR